MHLYTKVVLLILLGASLGLIIATGLSLHRTQHHVQQLSDGFEKLTQNLSQLEKSTNRLEQSIQRAEVRQLESKIDYLEEVIKQAPIVLTSPDKQLRTFIWHESGLTCWHWMDLKRNVPARADQCIDDHTLNQQ